MNPLAVITGASSGIGAEFARGLAARGYDCVVTARREDRLRSLADELEAKYEVSVTVIAADLGTAGGAEQLYRRVQELDRPVTFLVNNAGFGLYGHFVRHEPAKLQQMVQLNMVSLTTLTHLFTRDMVALGRGRVLQVASVGAFQPSPYYAVYSATKSYVRDFSQALHWELRGSGVTVSTICPGLTETEFHEVADHIKPSYLDAATMTAHSVAEIGIRGALRGRAHITPGVINKLMGWMIKLTPRSVATWLAGVSMASDATRAPTP
ncbi:MAG TPA: SDR family oxidoreductase [Polyangiaceae bacterium]|nr:SDR family oxidoreductase [Polyangiaceae bacterium]